MRRELYPTFLDWVAVNHEKYLALADAEDGNPFPLADFIEKNGRLATKEACSFVAATLKGEAKPRGAKRTVRQQGHEVAIFGLIRQIQKEENCSEYRATQIYLDSHPNVARETIRTYIRRAKATLKGALGREPTPVVLKSPNSEPE